jgi:integrase
LGFPDTPENRRDVALPRAIQIERDIKSGHFDSSLTSYKPLSTKPSTNLSAVGLFTQFTAAKAKLVSVRTLPKYHAALKYLTEFFGNRPASILDLDVDRFLAWFFNQNLLPAVHRLYLTLISSAWEWGIKQDLVTMNPWKGAPQRVKVAPKQMPKPFSREEIGAIIQAFRTNRYYHPYADYVEFLFGTGVRTSEAIGLRWGHVADDCSQAWIGESLTRGVRKSTKTNKARTISMTPKLTTMLKARKPATPDPEALVFTGPTGKTIDDQNFRKRAWAKILKQLEIDYRKPYTTRHTLISHALDLGMNPVMVAQLTGHDVQTLYQNYAGNVSSRPQLPEI